MGTKGMVTAALLPAMGCVSLAACEGHASKSLAWAIDNGESVEVSVDLGGGHDLSPRGSQSEVTHDGETVVNGFFADGEGYEARMAAIADEGDHGLIDPRTVAWGHGGEHSRIVRVGDDSCVVMGSVAGADEADAAYAAITIREG